MGITTISSVVAAPAPSDGRPALNPPTPQQQQQPPPASQDSDTVQLTEAQQVYQLYNQGQQVPQIAGTLNLSVTAVNSYLGLSNSSS
jgi:DNA-binding NarL/FixJ family response regulator